MGRTRSPQLTLTKRQREVLDLVAEGYSNREIGEALGISLEGAKWHVGELLSKFGVDSREELAALWKAERRSPVRWLAGLFGVLPGGAALKAGVAGAAVLLVGGIVALLVLARGSETANPSLGPGIWVALVAVGAPENELAPAPIRVFDAISGKERSFGPPELYVALAWSPRGDRLAALGIGDLGPDDDFEVGIRIWDASGEEAGVWRTGPDIIASPLLHWSPDGTRLAVVHAGGVAILDENARLVGDVRATPEIRGGSSSGVSTLKLQPWSPDSRLFATQSEGLLLIADRDGHGGEYDLPPRIVGAFETLIIRGWAAPDVVSVILVSDTPDGVEYLGTVEDHRIVWEDGRPVDWPALLGFDPRRKERLDRLLPGSRWSGDQRTADGSGVAAAILGEEDRNRQPGSRLDPRPLSLLVGANGVETLIDLGLAGAFRNPQFDVIIVPGWRGDAPKAVNKARPLPTPRPTPTEVPFTPGPDPGNGPIPYPAPKGGRVPSQVADLPLYPGAREVDGFVAKGTGGNPIYGNVQLFLTKDSEDQVFEFFTARLQGQGFRGGIAAEGVSGESWSFTNGRDRVLISTEYSPRPEDELPQGQPPYGFQGKGVRFIETIDGETFFFVVTLRAPEP